MQNLSLCSKYTDIIYKKYFTFLNKYININIQSHEHREKTHSQREVRTTCKWTGPTYNVNWETDVKCISYLMGNKNPVPYEWVKVAQSCPTLCDPMDCTVHGILQARILEWVAAVPFSRGSSRPRDWTQASHIVGEFFTNWATREAQEYRSG